MCTHFLGYCWQHLLMLRAVLLLLLPLFGGRKRWKPPCLSQAKKRGKSQPNKVTLVRLVVGVPRHLKLWKGHWLNTPAEHSACSPRGGAMGMVLAVFPSSSKPGKSGAEHQEPALGSWHSRRDRQQMQRDRLLSASCCLPASQSWSAHWCMLWCAAAASFSCCCSHPAPWHNAFMLQLQGMESWEVYNGIFNKENELLNMKIKSSKLNLSSFCCCCCHYLPAVVETGPRMTRCSQMSLQTSGTHCWEWMEQLALTLLQLSAVQWRRWSMEGEDARVAEIQVFYPSFASKSPTRESLLKSVVIK